MFTGIVEDIGTVKQKVNAGAGVRFVIETHFKEFILGESIAVNGVCLTVESIRGQSFVCYASTTTLVATTLVQLFSGDKVHLEKALKPTQPFGGHFLTGHVDAIGVVDAVLEGTQMFVALRLPSSVQSAMCVVQKGSIAVDGVSLTIANVKKDMVELTIIPETKNRTLIALWKRGKKVNIEFDILGKYVQNDVQYALKQKEKQSSSKITEDFLAENGFL